HTHPYTSIHTHILSPSLSHTLTYTHTPYTSIHYQRYPYTHTYPLSLRSPFFLEVTLTLCRSVLSHTHTHTHSHTLTLTHTHTHTHTHSHTNSHSHSRTHAHTHTQ